MRAAALTESGIVDFQPTFGFEVVVRGSHQFGDASNICYLHQVFTRLQHVVGANSSLLLVLKPRRQTSVLDLMLDVDGVVLEDILEAT
jgi:hypothetical protein